MENEIIRLLEASSFDYEDAIEILYSGDPAAVQELYETLIYGD